MPLVLLFFLLGGGGGGFLTLYTLVVSIYSYVPAQCHLKGSCDNVILIFFFHVIDTGHMVPDGCLNLYRYMDPVYWFTWIIVQ